VTVTTRTARMWLDDGGILRVIHAAGSEQTADDARENCDAGGTLAEGIKWPMLVDMSQVKSISREARTVYAQRQNAETVSALALVIGSPVSRVIGNFFIGLNKPAMPTRLFTSIEDATAWLRQRAGAPA
jgi:hypothetical protein